MSKKNTTWTTAQLQEWKERKNKKYTSKQTDKKSKTTKGNKQKSHIASMLKTLKLQGMIQSYAEEHKFSDKRRFRFDWAIPQYKVAIEYEGLMSEKSGHTTVTGFTKDCEKYNLAQLEGWKVLRYTALNYESVYTDLENILIKK